MEIDSNQILKNAVVLDITREEYIIRCFLIRHDLFWFRTPDHQPRFSSISDETIRYFTHKLTRRNLLPNVTCMQKKSTPTAGKPPYTLVLNTKHSLSTETNFLSNEGIVQMKCKIIIKQPISHLFNHG